MLILSTIQNFLCLFKPRFNYNDLSGMYVPVILEFERISESPTFLWNTKLWMEDYWWLSIVFSAIYIFLIFVGERVMEKRKAFDLRGILTVWNMTLAVFSIMGSLRSIPELCRALFSRGIDYTVCNIENIQGITGTWAWLFAMSKVPELFDTAFIVLRKQNLIFLHWFHHATVLIYTWYSYHDWTATGRWFITMNYTVHAFMYTYYTFRAMRFRIPRRIAMCVTTMQLSQMAVGCFVNCKAFLAKRRAEYCHVSDENIRWSFFMYFAYFLLFCQFFFDAYYGSRGRLSKNVRRQEHQAGSRSDQLVVGAVPVPIDSRKNGVVPPSAKLHQKDHAE